MMSSFHLTHAAEIYAHDGPTGDFAEVIAGQVQDNGGNVLFAGSADACVRERAGYRIPTRLVPTEWRRVAGEVSGADHQWQLVIEG
jgi:hypothetical protein